MLEKVDQRPLRHRMAELPSMAEVMEAVKKLKCGKAAGSNGIAPEMVKVACKDQLFREHLLDLIQSAWKERRVPQQWVDAILVPVPKKGELSLFDNWRGISLLDVVGKVAAKVVQGRLQDLVESVMPESQFGFRKGRGCTDMIYIVQQLVEKSWEHQSKIWFVFIDLKKAYDSVPREALWIALEKLGVPDSMIDLVRSFHQGMKAKIRLEDEETEEIEVSNGLRQGCCMAPALSNLYSCLLVDQRTARMRDVEDAGVDRRITQVSKAFGTLQRAVFVDRDLTTETKRKIYVACVLSILLYGSEC